MEQRLTLTLTLRPMQSRFLFVGVFGSLCSSMHTNFAIAEGAGTMSKHLCNEQMASFVKRNGSSLTVDEIGNVSCISVYLYSCMCICDVFHKSMQL